MYAEREQHEEVCDSCIIPKTAYIPRAFLSQVGEFGTVLFFRLGSVGSDLNASNGLARLLNWRIGLESF